MNILKNLIKTFLIVIISYYVFYFSVVYTDVVLSIGAKKELKGKIIYSLQSNYIKAIELPSGKKKYIYSVPRDPDRYLASVLSPSFYPDGKEIVFSKKGDPRVDFRYKLWTMNSDGTNIRKFLEIDNRDLLSPSFSPDGKKVVFVSRNSERGGLGGLYAINIDNPTSINCISNILPSLTSQLAWSPNSREIAFSSEELFSRALGVGLREEVDRGGIYIVDISDKSYRKVVELATEPSWSPDGSRLAYEGEKGYFIANFANDGYLYNTQLIIPYKRLFFGEGGSFPIRWSPDGKYLVFGKEIWPGLAGIYVVAADNPKKKIRIATDYGDIIGMSWVE